MLAYAVAEAVPSAALSEPADFAVARDLATRHESSGRWYLAGVQKKLSEDGATTRTTALVDPDLNSGSVAMSLLRRASAPLLLLPRDLHGPELHAAPPGRASFEVDTRAIA